ncbi:alanine or glycine:cation symporter, AGCS family [Alkalibacterium pelagium]|uniref:Alanine or glycine:cation symporter, AGCS family n=1 Tax=Alkalibacterium pelagium TaxID=426702 RepID=A0A1H7L8E4_9LACT|nr:sodium:alanine symporter family protein [Alkalibacterium pelagium]SEK95272.1 alanine or glycine:cation symporter, AGCS family [Alkalibacterium pelagium]
MERFMEWILEVNGVVNDLVWGWPFLILIVGTGVLLTVRTRFISFTKFGYMLKQTFLKIFSKSQVGEGEVTAFQAVSTALAATVGTGNIAGVGTAIAIGGPGAVFWMWIAALFGMATKYGEVVLAIQYREKTEDGRFVGGPMYYLEKGANMRWLAVLFAIFGAAATFGIGNMVQSNSVADSLNATFGIQPWITGIVLAVLVALVIVGGIKKIGKVTEIVVPFMAAIYILGGLIIIIANIQLVPQAFGVIFRDAFTGSAAAGGFVGSTLTLSIRYGVARGVFTNEAGLGSAPIAHAAATTDHPVRQGLWGIFEVFADTIVLCTITALVIVMTGAVDTGLDGAALTTSAFNEGIAFGGYIVTFGLIFFAFSTLLGWSYYGERCMEFLFGPKSIVFYRMLFIPLIVVGAIGGLRAVWALADTLNGLMALPNLIGLLILSPVIVRQTSAFFGKDGIYDSERKNS